MNHTLYLFTVWLHMLAAAVWLGGMAFLVLVLVPTLRRSDLGVKTLWLIRETGHRFRTVGWICLLLLLTSGLLLLHARGLFGAGGRGLWHTPFGETLAWKLLVVAALLVLSALHDFFFGPRATAAWRQDPAAPRTLRWRRISSWCGRLTLLLALLAVLLGVFLSRGRPW